ncbi:MAG: ASCH domain-containing protein [Rhodobacteraceae bacterium]|nr:ASCH domain-containing protein [Paracoccaceae bacterium]
MTLDHLLQKYPNAETFRCGDSEALSARLLGLMCAGAKTATCMAQRDVETGVEAMPKPGRRDIALHWDGRPALVIETLEVSHRRFCDVDADFALAEGENDSLEGWRADHETYFTRNGGFDPEMTLVCERFRVVEIVEPPK